MRLGHEAFYSCTAAGETYRPAPAALTSNQERSMPALPSSTGLTRPRIALTAIAADARPARLHDRRSRVNAPLADAGQSFKAQAKKKCKKKQGRGQEEVQSTKTVQAKLKKQAGPGEGQARQGQGRRDDPQPLPRSRPRPGDRCQQSPGIHRRQRRDHARTSTPTTSRSGPRASPPRSRPKSPDLVGLQEVALWRTGPPGLPRNKPADPPESFTSNDGQVRLPATC